MDEYRSRFPYGRPPINYEEKLVGWALEYDAYKRLAGGEWEPFAGALREVLLPLLEEFQEGVRFPSGLGLIYCGHGRFILSASIATKTDFS